MKGGGCTTARLGELRLPRRAGYFSPKLSGGLGEPEASLGEPEASLGELGA